MRHLLRMPAAGKAALACFLSCVLLTLTGCSRPSPGAAGDASASTGIARGPTSAPDGGARAPLVAPLPYGSGRAGAAPPADAGGAIPPPVLRAPDWDLSADDPAHDYARRYVFFTRRYPDPECVDVGPGVAAGDVKRVTVTTSASCPGAGTVRDVFLIDTAGDHLTVDDRTKRNPLARWPDGSDPEGPPGAQIRETSDMRKWKSPLQAALLRLSLASMRVQAYGRGTYLVVSLAGWHDPYLLNAPADTLKPLADALCAANDNMPMALVAGFDRAHVLRVRCPAATKWDVLQ